jgi:hypothetical protein
VAWGSVSDACDSREAAAMCSGIDSSARGSGEKSTSYYISNVSPGDYSLQERDFHPREAEVTLECHIPEAIDEDHQRH